MGEGREERREGGGKEGGREREGGAILSRVLLMVSLHWLCYLSECIPVVYVGLSHFHPG